MPPVSIMIEQDFPRGGGVQPTGDDDGVGGSASFKKHKKKKGGTGADPPAKSNKKDVLIVDKDEGAGSDDGDEDFLDRVARRDDGGLFKVAKPSKKIRDKARAAAAVELGEKAEEDESDFVVEPLTYDTIEIGLLCLSIVHEIRDHEVVVSLPGRTVGIIPMTAVSKPYSKLLQRVESGVGEIEAFKSLHDLFSVGQIIITRVTHVREVETEAGSIRRTVILTTDPNDLHSNYNATLVEEGMQFTAAVQSIEDHGFVMDIGIRGVRSFLPKNRAPTNGFNPGVGQLVQCKVVLAKIQRLLCNVTLQVISAKSKKDLNVVDDVNAALLLPGMVLDAHVMQAHKTGLKVYLLELMGTIHQDHMAQPWQLPLDIEKYSQVQATVLYTQPGVGTLPALTLRNDLWPGRIREHVKAAYPRGVSYQVTVERFEKRGLIIKFANGSKGIVSTRRCFPPKAKESRDASNATTITSAFPSGSKHRCRVLEYSELDDVYVGSFAHADAPVTAELKQQAGNVVKCSVVEWKRSGALVRLNNVRGARVMGFIPNLHFDKYDEFKTRKRHHPEDSTLKAKVFRVEADTNKILLTARKKLIQSETPVAQEVGECVVGAVMNGMVLRTGLKGLHVVVVGGVMGFVPASFLGVPSPYIERRYPVGEIASVNVVEVEPQRPTLIFSLLDEAAEPELPEPILELKTEESENPTETGPKTKKKKKRSKSESSEDADLKIKPESEQIAVEKSEPAPRPLKRSVVELRPATSSTSFWDDEDVPSKNTTEIKDEDAPAVPAKKTKRTRAAEREAEIRRQESALADPTKAPTSADDYELLLLASPHSSMAWIKYIAMHLEAGNLDEARAVGERALSTIPGAEEQERFNVWTALLNLENEHGTTDTLRTRFTAALRNCDELATYKQMAQIYITSKRNDEARSILRTMTKKFPTQVGIWSQAAQHFYKTKQVDEGRALYTRAVAALPTRNHVEIISKFAQLELAYGDFEQGRSLYEKLVGTYGARIDIWLVYINQLIKQKDHIGVRTLFERVSTSSVNPRKMQPVFKRWLEFEREHGTIESVAGVEETVAEYYKERLGLSVMNVEGGEQLT